jgi:hypothetical protein
MDWWQEIWCLWSLSWTVHSPDARKTLSTTCSWHVRTLRKLVVIQKPLSKLQCTVTGSGCSTQWLAFFFISNHSGLHLQKQCFCSITHFNWWQLSSFCSIFCLVGLQWQVTLTWLFGHSLDSPKYSTNIITAYVHQLINPGLAVTVSLSLAHKNQKLKQKFNSHRKYFLIKLNPWNAPVENHIWNSGPHPRLLSCKLYLMLEM